MTEKFKKKTLSKKVEYKMEKCFAGKSASLLHTHIYQASKGGIQVSSDNKRWNTSKCVKQEALSIAKP